jgi:hypothetical protein
MAHILINYSNIQIPIFLRLLIIKVLYQYQLIILALSHNEHPSKL